MDNDCSTTPVYSRVEESPDEFDNAPTTPYGFGENPQNIQEQKEALTTSTVRTGLSWYGSVFILINACLGAGLLNISAAYNKGGGIPVCISVQCLFAVVMCGSLVILCYCSDFKQSATFQDVVQSLLGNRAQVVASISVIVYAFGTCACFFIIIGDQWDKFLTFAYGPDYCYHWYMERKFTMISTSVLLVLPLCYPKKIDFLKYASIVGVLAILYSVFLIIVKYFIVHDDMYTRGTIKQRPENWTDVFRVIPTISFGFQVHLSVIPIYSCLEKRTMRNYSKTIIIAMSVCLFAYAGTASLGYLTFGDNINEDILLSYKPITADVLIAVIFIAFKMYAATPILTFVGRTAIESLWVYFRSLSPEDIIKYERTRRIVIATLWFSCALTTAVVVPNIGFVIAYLGGLDAIFVFIFPGFCFLEVIFGDYILRREHKKMYFFIIAVSIFYIVLGAFIFGLVITQSIMDDINGQTIDNSIGQLCP